MKSKSIGCAAIAKCGIFDAVDVGTSLNALEQKKKPQKHGTGGATMSGIAEIQRAAVGARNAAHELRDIAERMKSMGIPAKLWSSPFVHVRKAAEDLDELADVLYGLDDGDETEVNDDG